MCGIAGIICTNKNELQYSRLKSMTDVIAHRGPDGEGAWIDDKGTVGLGHRRLCIIDLSNEGAQPMHYADRYSIVFNGEIYNYIELREQCKKRGYQFRSQTDTEVLLALYDWKKKACLDLLDGMFAFAIYDSSERKLFCARDRFGEKPFYYSYEAGKHFVFGSEMKALWAAGISKELNKTTLFNYLVFDRYENPENAEETFYESCIQLPHASFLMLSCSNCTIEKVERYFDINWREQDNTITEKKAADKLIELFYISVTRRLRSDVPVGSSLSGGLDSSIIVAVINELRKGETQQQKTFSVRFPGFAGDEGEYMKSIIDQTNVSPYFTFPDKSVFEQIFPKVLYHQEEPFGGPSVLAQYEVMRLAKQHDVTVLLDGQGADEMLGGYHHYFIPYFKELYHHDWLGYKRQLQAYDKLMASNTFNAKMRFSVWDEHRQKVKQQVEKLVPGFSSRRSMRKALAYDLNYFDDHKPSFEESPAVSLQQALYHSMFEGGLQQLLRLADRNSMAHSREVRLPFLNQELVAFVFSLPSYLKIHNGWTKYILRTTFDPLLPKNITWRKEKIGFASPDLINRDHLSEMDQALSKLDFINEKHLNKIDVYKKAFILQLVNKPVTGQTL